MRQNERWLTKDGYIVLSLNKHPLFPGKTMEYEHRIKMAEHLGRKLRKGEIVHHKKAPRSNNRLSNLELKKSQKAHMQEHKNPCAPETKKKISQANKGKVRTKEQRAALSKARKGIPKSTVFKAQVSATMKGRPTNNPNGPGIEGAALISAKLKGRSVSESTRAKMRLAGLNQSDVKKEKLRQAALRQWKKWRTAKCS